jgi:hypothetical protein
MEAFVGTRAGELLHPLEGIGYHAKGKWPKGLKEWLILLEERMASWAALIPHLVPSVDSVVLVDKKRRLGEGSECPYA